ncbi:MAG: hypothetical protein KZQ70_04565 [gamma proteobacterium symbiont of Lucinoma myriamae]|nr:hypothetical protein [gamma proteobacterium symbiont of Lucinoma myriamae]MCU7817330.1 hypothetical protein [gamma proteobacterium symbiont of Lucinoma myriamae]
MNKFKIFVLGITVYLSKDLFFKIGENWFDELKDRDNFEDRVNVLRKSFWRSFFLVSLVIGLSVCYLVQSERTVLDNQLLLRMTAIVIALTASLGRGGWNIQSFKGKTVIERIDRGMFVLSQLGATVILLFALTLN